MKTLAIIFVVCTAAFFASAQQQSNSANVIHVICDSGCAGAGGGGLADLQVRSVANAWTDVGFFTGNLFLPAVLQTGANVIGSISNSGFNVNNFPATQAISSLQLPAALDGSGFLKTHEQGTAAISSLQLPAALDGSGFLKSHEQGTAATSTADGADVTQGAKADAKSTATDVTPITLMQVLKEISFMEQTPAPRSVTQGTSPWVDSITQWGGGTLGAMANYGTAPGSVLVPGVNAFVTNLPTGSLAAGTAPANGLGLLAQFNTTTPAPTNGQTVSLQGNSTGSLLVATEGRKTTYRIGLDNTTLATGVTYLLVGSGTKTVKVTKVELRMSSSAAAASGLIITQFFSALPTGGTSVTVTPVLVDPSNAAATAVFKVYSVAATGSSSLNYDAFRLVTEGTTTVLQSGSCTWQSRYGEGGQYPTLRSASQAFAITFGAAQTATGFIEWTEE